MDRLTKRLEDGKAVFHECHGTCGTCDGSNCYCIGPMVDRLAAYEDTGMEPQDVISAVDMSKIACALHELNAYKDLGSIEHLRELIQAEQTGRLVVLPCKVGDTVWIVDCEYMDCNNCDRLEHGKYCPYIDKPVCPNGTVRKGRFHYSLIPNFGKTVFLTREEAEAELKGGHES